MHQIQNMVLRLAILASLTLTGVTVNTVATAECTGTNTCFGMDALPADTGSDNSAFGFQALFFSTDQGTNDFNGVFNTAVGSQALYSNTNGAFNTAVGYQAMFNNLSASESTAFGYQALYSNTLGYLNTALGYQSLFTNTTGRINTAVGMQALHGNTTGQFNVGVGDRTLYYNKTGTHNTAVGHWALLGNGPEVGKGRANTATGSSALGLNTRGNYNTANGANALRMSTIANSNTAVGYSALYNTSTGNSNSAVGLNALYENTTGLYNTGHGVAALKNNVTGARNVAMGYQAGFAVTGSDNIVIGAGNQGQAAENGVIRIGISVNQKKAFIAGIRGVTTGLTNATAVFIDGNGQLGTINSSRAVKEDIYSMGDVSERLFALRPVTFRYKIANDDGNKPVQFGLIAEEVAETFPELVVYDANGKPETVSYHLLATLLLNEFQKAHSVIEAQASQIAVLEAQSAQLAQLKKEFAEMAAVIEGLYEAGMVATTH